VRKSVPHVASLCVLCVAHPGIAGDRVPKEAASVIAEVHDAADREDLDTLRTKMVDEFVWSFGGDGDADQAIANWRNEPDALKALARVTSGHCGPLEGAVETIQCPGNAGMDYRAGFQQTKHGWRMVWFVAGD
jgi:hypothetical protein